ncbi:hypothetical protein E5K00_14350 [Hymenobacter aquaticus]|uniref:TonB C-terminal domain-containing protein n=1 Tax=Hymenobacter aquaticus TaxID=1867101 RepID=A0A4Z0PX46_9BACT|nr:hypothetical protein [Hymenobacter aquaticus]TGE21463.1 hypothetical protein E5K00_14350 [Hymenobacter aquaticus]
MLHEAQRFLAARAKPYTGSGYVTFRFVIDCEGQMLPRVQVLQTNEAYQPFQFDKQLVADLFAYLKTLNQWKKARGRNDTPINYIAFLSFKLRDGKVAAIIP